MLLSPHETAWLELLHARLSDRSLRLSWYRCAEQVIDLHVDAADGRWLRFWVPRRAVQEAAADAPRLADWVTTDIVNGLAGITAPVFPPLLGPELGALITGLAVVAPIIVTEIEGAGGGLILIEVYHSCGWGNRFTVNLAFLMLPEARATYTAELIEFAVACFNHALLEHGPGATMQ